MIIEGQWKAPPEVEGGCEEYELLISKACDDECTEDELARLKAHLRGCERCRQLMRDYSDLSLLMTTRMAAMKCPQPPTGSRNNIIRMPDARKLLPGRRTRRYARQFMAVAACILFFVMGHYIGFKQAGVRIAETTSPIGVTTPSMWVAQREVTPALIANVESEQPFTDSIDRYRTAIGDELRNSDVNWMRVRELVEAMGELRTDLELLTIHMAYLDIRTGTSPYEVADHWETLGTQNRVAHKP